MCMLLIPTGRMFVMKASIQCTAICYSTLITSSNDKTFFQYFLIIIEEVFPQYYLQV